MNDIEKRDGSHGLEATAVLVGRIRGGDVTARDVLIQRNIEAIERIVRVRTGSFLLQRRQVEDVLGEVLLEACKSLGSFEPRSDARFIDWLAKLAENKIRSLAEGDRASKRSAPGGEVSLQSLRGEDGSTVGLQLATDATSVPGKLTRQELCAILDECLQEETVESHREVILKREYAGLSWDEVASELGCPSRHAAEELYQRAYRKLKERVQHRVRAHKDH